MSTSFPGAIDSLTNPAASDAQSAPSHAGQHSDINDAMEAVQAKVGITGSAVPTSLDYLVKTAADPGHTHGATSAPGSATAASMYEVAVKSLGQFGNVSSHSTGTALLASGWLAGTSIVSSSSARTLTSDGVGNELITTGSTGGQGYWSLNAENVVRLDQKPALTFRFRTGSSLAVCRIFVGLTDGAMVNELNSDTNAANKIGLQFSTARPDTNFQFVRRDATTQTLVDTGVAPTVSTTYHLTVVAASATSVTVTLRSASGASLATATYTTLLPASTAGMQVGAGIQTLENVAKRLAMFYVNGVLNPVAI